MRGNKEPNQTGQIKTNLINFDLPQKYHFTTNVGDQIKKFPTDQDFVKIRSFLKYENFIKICEIFWKVKVLYKLLIRSEKDTKNSDKSYSKLPFYRSEVFKKYDNYVPGLVYTIFDVFFYFLNFFEHILEHM